MARISDINVNLGRGNIPDVINDAAAINAMIGNCLTISPGERWWYPSFASSLRRYLFEPVDIVTAGSMEMDIENILRSWLPAITANVKVTPNIDQNRHDIVIRWKMRELSGNFVGSISLGASS